MSKNKLFNNNRYLIPILTIILVIYLYIIFTNNGVIVFYGDSLKQQIPFYSGLWEKVHQANMGFWDWSMLFGTNSFSQTFYCHLNNPYLYIILMFPKEWIPQVYTFTNILKIFLTYISVFWWLKRIKRSELASIVGAIIVTFSAWFLTMYEWGHLLDTFPLYFLILILVDNYLLYDKKVLLIFTIGLMTIINYYLSYMFLPFILVYVIYRYYILNEKHKLKEYGVVVLRVISFILIGVALSGVVLLPSASIVLMTPRIQSTTDSIIYNWDIFYRYFTSIFLPVAYRYSPNVLTNVAGVGWYGGVSLFSLFITPVMVISLIFSKRNKEKRALLVMISIFLLMTMFPVIYKLLQGSEETRWFYMFPMICALIGSYVVDCIFFDKEKLKIFVVISVLFCLVIGFSIYSFYRYTIIDYRILRIFLLMFGVFLLLYLVCLKLKLKNMLILLMTIEALIMFFNGLHANGIVDYRSIDTNQHQATIDYLQQQDDGFYRIQFSQGILENNASLDQYNYIQANLPYAYNARGTSGYSSLYSFQQDTYLNRYKDNWSFYQTEGRIFNVGIENIKYWIGRSEDLPPFGFSLFKDIEDELIYINDYFVELGFYSSKLIDESILLEKPFLIQDQVISTYIATPTSSNNVYEINYVQNVIGEWVDPLYFEYAIENGKDGTLLIVENFAMDYLVMTFKKDNKPVYEESIYQKQYVSVYCPPSIAFDSIVIQVDERVVYDSGIMVRTIQDFANFNDIYQNNQANALRNIKFENDHISADITIDGNDNGLVFTSIPFDDGWSISVNGKETEKIKVNFGFIGFEVEDGYNKIELDYYPPLLTEGIALSSVGLLLLMILGFKEIVLTKHQLKQLE